MSSTVITKFSKQQKPQTLLHEHTMVILSWAFALAVLILFVLPHTPQSDADIPDAPSVVSGP